MKRDQGALFLRETEVRAHARALFLPFSLSLPLSSSLLPSLSLTHSLSLSHTHTHMCSPLPPHTHILVAHTRYRKRLSTVEEHSEEEGEEADADVDENVYVRHARHVMRIRMCTCV